MTWWDRARQWRRAHPVVGDIVLALVVLVVGLTGQPSPVNGQPVTPSPAAAALLVVACAALVVRRRWPVPVWGVTLVAAAVSVWLVAGAAPAIVTAMVAVYTVATTRSPRVAVAIAAVTPLVLIVTYVAATSGSASYAGDATYTLTAVSGMACAIGFAVKNHRALLAAAEARAREAEQTREEEAQRRVTEERLRIARELHDVVAHHISVISVQSGVAQHLLRSDPDKAAEALGHVRDESGLVLSEMATVLGLLRSPGDTADQQPAPGLAQVDALVDAVRRRGTTVTVRTSGTPRELAPGTDLAAYRIVQESLTNAAKHGTGAAEVALDYRPDALVIDVANRMHHDAAVDRTPDVGGGHGLVGMRERVAVVGGRIEAGAHPDGRFVVHAELPTGAAS